ncbi:ATP-dependent RNA helicase DbpA [Maricurvus nonylphenolicus]|uniref:ATP-dependent RNA helicase DbpA n=1 Tax=Maricurvus nonylphenolicus TaxID=1008307 RepID=UPI0036F3D867
MSSNAFASLSLDPALLKNLQGLGYKEMTPIQAQSLPPILEGKDVIAKAKTGSGKTAAFALGLLNKLEVKRFRIQTLVMCPTRELADQVSKEIRRLARAIHNIKVLTLCGGMPFGPQIGSLEHGAHIVVGTPGRLLEHLDKGRLKLDDITTLVLDEADRMLDMGFRDDIRHIASQMPANRQTLLFSATYPDEIQSLSADFQKQPVSVSVESVHSEQNISQLFYQIEKHERVKTLMALLSHHRPQSTVIFCNTKRQTQDVADELQVNGFHALAIHGDMEQKERDQVLVRFANQSSSILVATDVAARGLDIKDLEAVINFELSRDPEVHVHRIGRTGRAGSEGVALSLYTQSETYKLEEIEDYINKPLSWGNPDDLVDNGDPVRPPMVTLQIDGGKKSKVRPGDILGALTGEHGIEGAHVGKIDIFPFHAYVAVKRASANRALKSLQQGKIKGRNFKVRKLR